MIFRHPLANEISWALCFKLAAIIILFLAFFSPAERPEVTTQSVIKAIFGTSGGDQHD